MKTSTILKRAKKLISDPKRWTRHAYARTASRECAPVDPDAKCWCAIGAVSKVVGFDPDFVGHLNELLSIDPVSEPLRALSTAARRFGEHASVDDIAIDIVNDRRDHATVLRMFDSAIRLAERQEAKGQR